MGRQREQRMSWKEFIQGIVLALFENPFWLVVIVLLIGAPMFNACNETVRAFAPVHVQK